MSGNAPPQPKHRIVNQWVFGGGGKANSILFMDDVSPTIPVLVVIVVTIPNINTNAKVDRTIVPAWDRTTFAIVVLSIRDGTIVVEDDDEDVGILDTVDVAFFGVNGTFCTLIKSSVIRVLSFR